MLVRLINLFAVYLLVSLLARLVLKILPTTINEGFSVIATLRNGATRFVMSIYGTKTNFEVNITAIFIFPFVLLLIGYSTLSTLVFLNTDYPILNIWLILTLIFILASFAPTSEELYAFREVLPSSIFFFIFKLAFVFQLLYSYSGQLYELIILILVVTPISPYLTR